MVFGFWGVSPRVVIEEGGQLVFPFMLLGELPYYARGELLSKACVEVSGLILEQLSGTSCLVLDQPPRTRGLVLEQPPRTRGLVLEQPPRTRGLE
jgi:hypothetical protein